LEAQVIKNIVFAVEKRVGDLSQDCSGMLCFPSFWPNPGPGHLPLDSGRGTVEFACVFASVAPLVVSFVSECIFWNPLERKVLKYARAMASFRVGDQHACHQVCSLRTKIGGRLPGATPHTSRANLYKTDRQKPAMQPAMPTVFWEDCRIAVVSILISP